MFWNQATSLCSRFLNYWSCLRFKTAFLTKKKKVDGLLDSFSKNDSLDPVKLSRFEIGRYFARSEDGVASEFGRNWSESALFQNGCRDKQSSGEASSFVSAVVWDPGKVFFQRHQIRVSKGAGLTLWPGSEEEWTVSKSFYSVASIQHLLKNLL